MILARTLRIRPGRSSLVRAFADWGAMREAFDSAPPSSKPSAPTPVSKQAAAVPSTAANSAAPKNGAVTMKDYFQGGDLGDSPPGALDESLNWSSSFHGLGNAAFGKEAQEILASEIEPNDVEITPDGLLYLPEIKYRRILNRAFGAGGWGLAPRSETLISKQGLGGQLTREYALVVNGRLVSIARGEQQFFADKGIPTATEGCKSNALMRCCKDLGIASELWDPRFIRTFKRKYCEDIFVEHVPTKKKKKIWKRKDETVEYPFKQ
ncbi:unnamed protein product [Kuraishia capsulata CBS 1993]|uniref:Mitochondrial genome maintenance protein MGM101 n=1 Tax=Kuraishia capsulata CBS 1993 TaxID=1382522 RepID=W6MT01_9ASCO|nr:uncharacterized protein KUCA_T00005945001 [Kuraishia capsulata CBS 1993]CDK29951.1 unnamed protein product [Kuraishia capsulata CBS 1993]